MQQTIEQQMARLEAARQRASEMERERSRLKGELDATDKRMAELGAKCKADLGCTLAELPELVKQLEAETEKSIQKAEKTLGMGGTPVQGPAEPDEEPTDEDGL